MNFLSGALILTLVSQSPLVSSAEDGFFKEFQSLREFQRLINNPQEKAVVQRITNQGTYVTSTALLKGGDSAWAYCPVGHSMLSCDADGDIILTNQITFSFNKLTGRFGCLVRRRSTGTTGIKARAKCAPSLEAGHIMYPGQDGTGGLSPVAPCPTGYKPSSCIFNPYFRHSFLQGYSAAEVPKAEVQDNKCALSRPCKDEGTSEKHPDCHMNAVCQSDAVRPTNLTEITKPITAAGTIVYCPLGQTMHSCTVDEGMRYSFGTQTRFKRPVNRWECKAKRNTQTSSVQILIRIKCGHNSVGDLTFPIAKYPAVRVDCPVGYMPISCSIWTQKTYQHTSAWPEAKKEGKGCIITPSCNELSKCEVVAFCERQVA